jgi:hypothetical protein
MNNKMITRCEYPDKQEDCPNYLDNGHGQCWCFTDMGEGLYWCNDEFCKKSQNDKGD